MSSTVKCPNCHFQVTPGVAPGHCCGACALAPGKHGPMCKRIAHPPGQCHSCSFASTGIVPNHCCMACQANGGQHGPACQRRPVGHQHGPPGHCPPGHAHGHPAHPHGGPPGHHHHHHHHGNPYQAPVNTVSWVPSSGGAVPPGALAVTGTDHYYVARVQAPQGLFPGKVHPAHKVCYYGMAFQEHNSPNYEVLVAPGARWVPFTGSVPPNAIPGGRAPDGETLYIGKFNNIPGKVKANTCFTAYGGKETSSTSFEILVN